MFAGEGWGGQPMFRAYDKKTGEIVWETKLPGTQTGLPMTYMVNGKQYIAFTVGDPETDRPAELIAFCLSGSPTENAAVRPVSLTVDNSGTENRLTPGEAADGWILLFNGKTLDGWSPVGNAKWKVEDGTIAAVAVQGPSYLRTNRQFTNFQLRADFWGEKSTNSGVFLRCPASDSATINQRSCYEVNIFDPHETFPTGSVVDVRRIEGTPDTAGRWNSYEILADGPRLLVKMNGKVTVDTRDGKLTGGTIALQSFGSGLIKFRNVKIRPLE